MQAVWDAYKTLEGLGVEAGRVFCKWHDWYINEKPKEKGARIRFMWKSMGIPPSAAYRLMGEYKDSLGDYKKPEVEYYTQTELEKNAKKPANENRLALLFKGCGFNFLVRQNCATREFHFNVVFSALTEKQLKELAKRIKPA